jgi:hypothetical protein
MSYTRDSRYGEDTGQHKRFTAYGGYWSTQEIHSIRRILVNTRDSQHTEDTGQHKRFTAQGGYGDNLTDMGHRQQNRIIIPSHEALRQPSV